MNKLFPVALAFLLGVLIGAVVWYLTVPPLVVQHTYLHTTVCEYYLADEP